MTHYIPKLLEDASDDKAYDWVSALQVNWDMIASARF